VIIFNSAFEIDVFSGRNSGRNSLTEGSTNFSKKTFQGLLFLDFYGIVFYRITIKLQRILTCPRPGVGILTDRLYRQNTRQFPTRFFNRRFSMFLKTFSNVRQHDKTRRFRTQNI